MVGDDVVELGNSVWVTEPVGAPAPPSVTVSLEVRLLLKQIVVQFVCALFA